MARSCFDDVVTLTVWNWICGQKRVGSQGTQVLGWRVDGVGAGPRNTKSRTRRVANGQRKRIANLQARQRKRVSGAVESHELGRNSEGQVGTERRGHCERIARQETPRAVEGDTP